MTECDCRGRTGRPQVDFAGRVWCYGGRVDGQTRRRTEVNIAQVRGGNRLQRVCKVATLAKSSRGNRLGEVDQDMRPPWRFVKLARMRDSVMIRALAFHLKPFFARVTLLFFRHNASYIHYLRQPPVFHDEAVFALSVEQIRPMAGRPVWRVPWGFHMTLWESAAVTYLSPIITSTYLVKERGSNRHV
jgi:hypothetical protein